MKISLVLKILRTEIKQFREPAVTLITRKTRDPYKILISTILSLRTKDETTFRATENLFKHAKTPEEMIKLSIKNIEKIIYPTGFYKVKAKRINKISKLLIDKYNSQVPDDLDELLKIKGIGRKTANLVITMGYQKMGICVDTHVHRISNRFGYINTKTPEKTEFALRKKLPKKHWIEYNDILVTFGQNICAPISPKCSQCVIKKYCPKISVKKFR
ncbi:MAG: endonuclease III [Nanoarchaeota archaeon]|nr:endonuclease III [Nanoarchaeota archaeon]MBU1030624.1 endonuclease III [Nanoarchaeota archaeon]MBU1850567.1 endonuclease III [Nanoarchaeota archaeon]